ncbi:MAG: hypothetical protein J2O47_09350 [Acidimicrobiaceae bacterium]|nr:hypothetical protein [Acidimicrobiaceae bacterium]
MITPIRCPGDCDLAGTDKHDVEEDGTIHHEKGFGPYLTVYADEVPGEPDYRVSLFVDAADHDINRDDPAVVLLELAGACLNATRYVAEVQGRRKS